MNKFEKLENNAVRFTFNVSAAAFDAAANEAFTKTRSKFNVPGFRKGKAPRSFIEKAYGEKVFMDEAFEEILKNYYFQSLELYKLYPKGDPELDIISMEKDKQLSFSLKFTVDTEKTPSVTLGAYKGVSVNVKDFAVTEAAIDEALNSKLDSLKNDAMRVVGVERPVENGDTVVIDYSGSVDGVKFEGGTAEKQTLEIGSGSFIPGFEEQLIGMKIGEEKDISVTFPEEYHAPELAGKNAVFSIKLHEVSVKEYPELNDEFAEETSEFSTMEEYKASLKAEITKKLEEAAENNIKSAAVDTACAACKITVPDELIANEAHNMAEDALKRMGAPTASIEEFCTAFGGEPQEIINQFKPEAEKRMKIEAMLAEIAYAENIVPSEEQLLEFINNFMLDYFMRSYYGISGKNDEAIETDEQKKIREEAAAKYMDSVNVLNFEYNYKCDKAQSLIIDSMERVAKKTAAKKPTKKAEKEDKAEKEVKAD